MPSCSTDGGAVLFAYVATSLGQCRLIKGEDAGEA